MFVLVRDKVQPLAGSGTNLFRGNIPDTTSTTSYLDLKAEPFRQNEENFNFKNNLK